MSLSPTAKTSTSRLPSAATPTATTMACDKWFVSTVAVDSGNMLGISLTGREFRETSELHLMAVDPMAQGRGIGRALIDHVAADLGDDGCMLLSIHTVGPSLENEFYTHSRSFYRATGSHPLEEHNILDWAGLSLILVRKL